MTIGYIWLMQVQAAYSVLNAGMLVISDMHAHTGSRRMDWPPQRLDPLMQGEVGQQSTLTESAEQQPIPEG